VRILCITDEFPWPVMNGLSIRNSSVIRALATLGNVDLFSTVTDGRPPGEYRVPPRSGVQRAVAVPLRPKPISPRVGLELLGSRRPRHLVLHDWSAVRRALVDFLGGPYDLVWFAHLPSWVLLHDLLSIPTVVDLDNLYDQSLRAQRRLVLREPAHALVGYRGQIRRQVGRLFDWVDERRWARLQLAAADQVEAVVVCSEVDRERLGDSRAYVLPNGYDLDDDSEETDCHPVIPVVPAVEATDGASSPVLTMVGWLAYAPNLDAATIAAEEILPRVRARYPGARLRLVGHHDDRVVPLARIPGVEVLGEVDDLSAALAGTDVVIVPIRFGSGTRIKVLEGFARRLPIVSTSIGCEGLDAVDGRHLLVADDPEAFAEACLQLIEDADLRLKLTAEAHELWFERFRWSQLREVAARIASNAASGAVRAPTQ
jgi:glycosyltransferase involved in cell wall biosynthesis